MLQLKNIRKTIPTLILLTLVVSLSSCNRKTIISPTIEMLSLPNEHLPIDLDRNGSVDFTFYYKSYETTDDPTSARRLILSVRPNNSNQIQFTLSKGPIPLQDGTSINKSIGWENCEASLAFIKWNISTGWDSLWSGLWIGVTDQNLGVRIQRQGLYYYGWIKLSITPRNGQLTISDYAYQPLPDTEILAGIHP